MANHYFPEGSTDILVVRDQVGLFMDDHGIRWYLIARNTGFLLLKIPKYVCIEGLRMEAMSGKHTITEPFFNFEIGSHEVIVMWPRQALNL